MKAGYRGQRTGDFPRSLTVVQPTCVARRARRTAHRFKLPVWAWWCLAGSSAAVWLVVHGAGASSKASSLLVRRPPCGRRRPWTVQRRPHPRTIGAVGARGAVVSSSNVAGGYKALRVKARAVFVRRPPREHRRSWSYGGVLLPPVCEQQYVGCRCLGATADVRRCRRTRAR